MTKQPEKENAYEKEYSDKKFWEKIKKYAKAAGEAVLKPALTLYYVAEDEDTPAWAKSVIYGALGYFISVLDAIPDLTPMVGFSDDLGALVAVSAAIAVFIKDKHKREAEEKLEQWFGESKQNE